MSILSWILLGLAIMDIAFTIVQLFVLVSMELIVHTMKPVVAWLVTVGPAVLVFIVATLALSAQDDRLRALWLVLGYGCFVVFAVYQWAAMLAILEKRREWDENTKRRHRVKSAGH